MRMLDLFSGLGGASEAMLAAGWEVHRLENNLLLKDVPGTIIQDIQTWPFQEVPAGYYDLIWASPPCVDFSDGYSSPKMRARRAGEDYNPDLTLVKRSIEIIEYLMPEYHVIENVRGAQPYFEDLLGKPNQIIGSAYLWGKFPKISVPAGWKMPSKYENDAWSSDPLRANKRAKIPYEISNGLRLAIQNQMTLDRWL